MNPLLLGIDGLSYTSFMKCNPRTLFTLFSSTYRGVVLNKKPQFPQTSWMSVLELKDIKDLSQVNLNSEVPRLLRETNAVAINLPITNPTYGKLSLPYDTSVNAEEEINKVTQIVLESVKETPVVASITAIDRLLHKDATEKCKIYSLVDAAVRKILNNVDDFIIFSIYGEPKSDNEDGNHEDYGVFLATIPRPSEHETVKLHEIGELFIKLVKKEYY
ncbi:hypothetical protein SULI_00245 [Saccharolobus solfataricus]|nr:hypothetical protein [Saccharolobus solfataricus]AKA72503.1 hypothetical protein SULB_0049 [Saccharolobus solfataricus]AKA77673.1 hypothetical protein SULC_0048 [Saccharolobus solfataricus]AKA80363.1 hypothetical protein SULA_0048 [Saccharolobus solfataricus]AZF69442.1 hypothetical protein SULG_00245 [Saccharolobus solfataricus]AZF72062.1 hypothetical protein SULH_00245 [Saccharolobus solfataricus]